MTLSGFIQLQHNCAETAEENLQAAVRIDAAYATPYVLLADLYNEESRFDDAVSVSTRAVVLRPGAWLVHYEMARAFVGKHRYDLALSSSEAGLQIKHHGTLLHLAKAHALIGLKQYTQAAAEVGTYLRYQPVGEASRNARELLGEVQQAIGE